jgi:hypothetical protein
MQNLLEIQNALRSAPDQQLMSLMQGANSSVPQWAVASELNSRKEMRDEQTRQEGLGQPTVLEGLMGAASAPTPQTNVAGMPQDVASGMAQSMAPKTDTTKDTGIATMASGGILKMGLGGDLDAQFILTDIPELGIRAGQFVKVSAETLEGLNNTLPEVMAKHGDKVASVQSYVDDGYRGLASAAREGDALIPTRVKKYVESTSPASEVVAPVKVPAATTNFSPMGIPVDSPTLSPETMSLAPTSPQGVEVLDIAKDARPATNTPKRMSTPVGLARLAAAGDADMLDETIGVQTAPSMPASPGIAAGTPFSTTKYTPRLPEKPIKAIQTGVDDKGRGIFIPSLEETQLDNLRGRSGVGAFSKVPFNATSDEAAKESVSQARVTADEPGTELAETAGRPASDAQLEAFTDAAALRNTALTVPTKPKVFDALEDIRFQELMVNDSPDNQTPVEQILIDQIKKLRTPQEQAAAVKLTSDKHLIAVRAEEAARKELAEARKNDTGIFAANKKLEAAQKETNRIQRVAPWVLEDNFGIKSAFGPEISKLVVAQAANDLQAEAVADVAKVTANENYPVSPVEVRKRLRAMEEKDADADERFDLAEARLDAERAEGLTAGENAFVVPSKTKPFVPPYGSKFAENSAFLNDEADYDGSSMDGLNTDGPFMPNEDTRIKRMKALAEQINSGELTGNSLLSAQKTLERLRKGVVRSGGEEELGNYLAKQTAQGVKKALPYAVDTADYVVRNLGLGTLAGATLGPRAEGFLLDKTDAAQTNTASPVAEIPTSANEVAAEAIASSVSKGDLTGSKPSGSVSLGAAITDSQKEQAAINAAQGIDELSFLNNDSNAEVQRRAGLYKDAFTEQDAINVERERKEAEAALAAAVGPVPSPAGAPMPFSKDSTDSAEQFYNNLPLLDQSVKNGNVVTPATRTGIATINPMDNRASDSPSSYEQKLLDILDKREKSADQDKWLGLAEMGMRLMASSNPNMLSAIGEAGLGASQTFLGNKQKAEAQEMDILTKLSALESRKQIADDANRTRLEAANISSSGRSPVGMVTNKTRLSETAKQIKAVQASLDGYRGSNLSSTQAQEKSKLEDQLKILNAEYTSLYNNQGSILGTALAEANTPVNLT